MMIGKPLPGPGEPSLLVHSQTLLVFTHLGKRTAHHEEPVMVTITEITAMLTHGACHWGLSKD